MGIAHATPARKKRLIIAALLGAAVGCSVMHGYAAATSCATPYWRLALSSSDEPNESLWPNSAILQASHPLSIGSLERDAKIYRIEGVYP